MKTASKKTTKKARRRARTASVGEQIIAGLQEAIAFERGDRQGAKVSTRRRTARDTTAAAARHFSAREIAELRTKTLGLSQPVFARALNVSPATVRAWEQKQKKPGGPALRLLEIAAKHPAVITSGITGRIR